MSGEMVLAEKADLAKEVEKMTPQESAMYTKLVAANSALNERISVLTNMARDDLVANEQGLLSRGALISKLIDPRRDYDKEAGYPTVIGIEDYKKYYRRKGLGRRVVEVKPEECWSVKPKIVEDPTPEKTTFEQAWIELNKKHKLLATLKRLDILSGIGRFGVLLLGFSDGKWDKPVRKGAKLLYVRPLDESHVEIKSTEKRTNNERIGLPVKYSISLASGDGPDNRKSLDVHWTRVIHVVEDPVDSRVFGTPRMEPVFDRIVDGVKVSSGNGEMFWKGGFPGLSFELMPGITDPDIDNTALKQQVYEYQHGMQRYLTLIGLSAKSLAPQVADPEPNYMVIIKDMCITLGIPVRVFMGSEEGKLASGQDSKAWNLRMKGRQEDHLTANILEPLIDRLIEYNVLPKPKRYEVQWPDRNTQTDEEKANVGQKISTSLQRYVRDNVSRVMPLPPYLEFVCGFSPEQVKVIMDMLEKQMIEHPEGLTPQPAGLTSGGRTRQEEDEAPDQEMRGSKNVDREDNADEDVTI